MIIIIAKILLKKLLKALKCNVFCLTGGQGVVSSSLATRTKKACNLNDYRLFYVAKLLPIKGKKVTLLLIYCLIITTGF